MSCATATCCCSVSTSDAPVPLYFEDFTIGWADRFGHVVVARDEVLAFAARYDPQPFHLDDAAAAANLVFGRIAASGWHTAAMAMRLIVDRWQALDVRTLGAPGLDELAWLRPVYPGDALRLESEVLETRPSRSMAGVGFVKIRTIAFNQEDVPVMRKVANVMLARRPG